MYLCIYPLPLYSSMCVCVCVCVCDKKPTGVGEDPHPCGWVPPPPTLSFPKGDPPHQAEKTTRKPSHIRAGHPAEPHNVAPRKKAPHTATPTNLGKRHHICMCVLNGHSPPTTRHVGGSIATTAPPPPPPRTNTRDSPKGCNPNSKARTRTPEG